MQWWKTLLVWWIQSPVHLISVNPTALFLAIFPKLCLRPIDKVVLGNRGQRRKWAALLPLHPLCSTVDVEVGKLESWSLFSRVYKIYGF